MIDENICMAVPTLTGSSFQQRHKTNMHRAIPKGGQERQLPQANLWRGENWPLKGYNFLSIFKFLHEIGKKEEKKCFNCISTTRMPAKAGVRWSKYTTYTWSSFDAKTKVRETISNHSNDLWVHPSIHTSNLDYTFSNLILTLLFNFYTNAQLLLFLQVTHCKLLLLFTNLLKIGVQLKCQTKSRWCRLVHMI